MSAKINKNGKGYPLGFMPEHYPADRVYLDGDTSKTVQDECVRKTGDTMTGDLTLSKAATVLKIRAAGSRYHNIASAASGSDKDVVLPNKSGTIALTSDIITNPLAGCDIIGTSNQLYLYNFKTIFCNKRTPVLCWYSDQTGNSYVFIIFTGQDAGGWNVEFINIFNAGSISTSNLSFDGNHLVITGLGNWGYGSAIGLMAGYV